MALRKPAAPAATTAPGGFEDMEGGVATAESAPAVQDPPVADPAAASVAATTAIAKAANTSMVAAKKFVLVLKGLENAYDPVTVMEKTRLKSGAGCIKDSEGVNYGAWVTLQLLSFHDSWTLSPGSDTDEAKEAVRYSLDGKTIDGTGEDVNAYLENLRTVEGYDKANKKKYLILAGIIVDSEKAKESVDSVVQVSLAPQSAKTFHAYHDKLSVRVCKGLAPLEGAEIIRITAEGATMNGKDFTKLVVSGA